MKKEQFLELGLDEELASKCEKASQEELKGYIPKTRFDEINTEKKKLEADVNERNKQLEDLKNATCDVETLKAQITSLQEENKKKDEAHIKEIHQLKIDTAVKDALVGARAKNTTAVKALLKGLDNAVLDDNGLIVGLSEQIEQLKKSDSYLFEEKTKPVIKGAKIGESNNENVPKIDTSKMTYSEMMEMLAKNPNATID